MLTRGHPALARYPVCTPVGWPARGFPSGSHSPHNPTCTSLAQTDMTKCNTHGCIAYGKNSFRKMGFSLRTDEWRCDSSMLPLV